MKVGAMWNKNGRGGLAMKKTFGKMDKHMEGGKVVGARC